MGKDKTRKEAWAEKRKAQQEKEEGEALLPCGARRQTGAAGGRGGSAGGQGGGGQQQVLRKRMRCKTTVAAAAEEGSGPSRRSRGNAAGWVAHRAAQRALDKAASEKNGWHILTGYEEGAERPFHCKVCLAPCPLRGKGRGNPHKE